MTCPECGNRTGTGGLCLPCRVGLKSVSTEAARPFQVLCRRCAEPLKDRKSRQRGYGPTCWVITQVEGDDQR